MIAIPGNLLGSLFTTMFVRYNHNPFILNIQTAHIAVTSVCSNKQITIISTYFFRIVKERNYLLDPKDQT